MSPWSVCREDWLGARWHGSAWLMLMPWCLLGTRTSKITMLTGQWHTDVWNNFIYHNTLITIWSHNRHPHDSPSEWTMGCLIWVYWRPLTYVIQDPHCSYKKGKYIQYLHIWKQDWEIFLPISHVLIHLSTCEHCISPDTVSEMHRCAIFPTNQSKVQQFERPPVLHTVAEIEGTMGKSRISIDRRIDSASTKWCSQNPSTAPWSRINVTIRDQTNATIKLKCWNQHTLLAHKIESKIEQKSVSTMLW